MDNLKQQVVSAVFDKVKEIDSVELYPLHPVNKHAIKVMEQTDNLGLQIKVKTPNGSRFFIVKIQEKY